MRNTILVAIVAFLSACMGTIDGTGGSTGGPGGGGSGNNSGPDGGGGGGGGSGSGSGGGGVTDGGVGMGDAAGVACKNKVLGVTASGQHNPGQDCMQGCHNHGFTLSGTLYASANGTTPLVGATVTVTDAANKTFDMVTALNGNFSTSTSVTFPIKVIASSCPSATPMIGTITAGNGGCNKGGCHAAGAAGKIHLP